MNCALREKNKGKELNFSEEKEKELLLKCNQNVTQVRRLFLHVSGGLCVCFHSNQFRRNVANNL